MPSRADRPRLERWLRTAAWLALGALVVRTFLPGRPDAEARRVVGTAALRQALDEALAPGARPIDVVLDALPDVGTRALARAVAAAGTPVRWRASANAPLPELGLVAEPVAGPEGRTRLTVLGGGARVVALRDGAGAIDSAQLSEAGVRVLDALAGEAVQARAPRGEAAAVRHDSVMLRPVLVVGRAGWEGKFAVAALEEAGWPVEARLAVAPGANVRQGGDAPLDTGRYAAVVALDESVAPLASAMSRYVRSGGGLLVLADAGRVPALGALLPAAAGAEVAAIPGALVSATPRRGLGGVGLVRLTPNAVALERDGARVRLAASRVQLGRVLLSGYRDSWRWRMEGDDAGPAAHRAWWSGLVASVAYAPLAPRLPQRSATGASAPGASVVHAPAPGTTPDPAPYAALVAALGAPASAVGAAARPDGGWPVDAFLFALFTMAWLGEWGSRRLRGVP